MSMYDEVMTEELDEAEGSLLADAFAESEMFSEERDITVITEEIKFYKQQAGVAVCEIGKRLCEAKAQLHHGEWLRWLEQEVEFSERSAQQYMRLWNGYGKSATVADLGASKALVLLALPENERSEFLEEKHEINGSEKTALEMTRKELQEAIRERDEARAAARRSEENTANQFHAAQDAAAKMEAAQEKARELEKELEELRKRPVDVAVQTVDATEEQLEAARRQAVEKVAEKKKELEEQLAKAQEEAKAAAALAESATERAEKAEAEASAMAEQKAEGIKKAYEMRVKELQKKLATADPSTAAFRIYFNAMQSDFSEMFSYYGAVKSQDEEKAAKLKTAVLAALEAELQQAKGW